MGLTVTDSYYSISSGASNPLVNGTHPLAAFFYALRNLFFMPGVDEYKTRKGNKSAVFTDCLKRPVSTILLVLFFIQKTVRRIMSRAMSAPRATSNVIPFKFKILKNKKTKVVVAWKCDVVRFPNCCKPAREEGQERLDRLVSSLICRPLETALNNDEK